MMLWVLLDHSPLYMLRQGLSLSAELMSPARLASHPDPGFSWPCLLSAGTAGRPTAPVDFALVLGLLDPLPDKRGIG